MLDTQIMERAHHLQVFGCRRSSILLCLYGIFYAVYLATGGLIFATLESPVEQEFRQDVIHARQQFLKDHPCVTGIIYSIINNNNKNIVCTGAVRVCPPLLHLQWQQGHLRNQSREQCPNILQVLICQLSPSYKLQM